jgi:hypothetical protein
MVGADITITLALTAPPAELLAIDTLVEAMGVRNGDEFSVVRNGSYSSDDPRSQTLSARGATVDETRGPSGVDDKLRKRLRPSI